MGNVRSSENDRFVYDYSLKIILGVLTFKFYSLNRKICVRFVNITVFKLPLESDIEKKIFDYFRKRFKYLLRQMVLIKRIFYLEWIVGRFEYGFENPATTGEVQGYLSVFYVHPAKRIRIFPVANFLEPCFKGRLQGQAMFIPIWLVLCVSVAILRGFFIHRNGSVS